MKKEDQTDAVKKRLYDLTQTFVRSYVPKYYYQYRGDLHDLATEIYCQFLTPKSRIKGKEETLLDKYDPAITHFEYLVKVSVIRMLIDRSRADSQRVISINRFVDEYGDMMLKTFNLTDSAVDEPVTSDVIARLTSRYEKASDQVKSSIKKQYEEVRSTFSSALQKVLDRIFIPKKPIYLQAVTEAGAQWFPCQQVTDKTVCLLIDGRVHNFNRESGDCKSASHKDWQLTTNTMSYISEIVTYHSGYSRIEFQNLKF